MMRALAPFRPRLTARPRFCAFRRARPAAVALLAPALAFLFAAAAARAQVGGATAPAPLPDQIAANQDANPTFAGASWAGYGYNNPCVTLGAAPLGGIDAANVADCPGGQTRIFDLSISAHNHEAFLVRYDAYAAPGSLTDRVWTEFFDNCHGGGVASVSAGPSQTYLYAPSSVYTKLFSMNFSNIVQHGSDSACIDIRFEADSPAWPGAGKSASPGYEIVDSNGSVEQVTSAGTTGSAAPAWCTTTGCTTADNTVTWTNEGPNPPFYLTNIEAEETWFPLRTFLLYPNYRGYLWSDLLPPKRYTQIQPVSAGSPFYNFLGAGSAPVAGEIMGVTTIDPPPADSLSQLTLTVKLATVAGCASGVLAADTFSPPQSVQPWQFTPAQYGSLSIGSAYYVCSSLFLTSGMALVDSYPDWKIYYENPAFRAALTNWYDPSGTWEHNGSPLMLLGTYDRWSATFRANTTAGQTSDTAYIQGIGSLGPVNAAPQALNAPSYVRQNGSFMTDYCSQGFTGTLSSFGTFSAIDPLAGNDQLTPYLKTYSEFCPNLTHWNIFNPFAAGCLVTEQQDSTSAPNCTVAPAFSPGVTTATGGSISANYLFLEAVGVSASGGCCSATSGGVTLPSSPLAVNLSSASCAGANCSVTISMPACATPRWLGWRLYAATGAASTPPANSAFQLQYPAPSAGMLANSDTIPCGASVALSAVNTGPAPPATDTTYQVRPFWAAAGSTDETIWNDVFSAFNSSTYKSSVGGLYLCDECAFPYRGLEWEIEQQLYADTLNLPVASLLIGPGITPLWRDQTDLIGEDPYGIGFACCATANNYATGEAATRNCTVYNGFNAAATITNCFPSTVDVDTDDVTRWTFGSRPEWMVIDQFGHAMPYAVMNVQIAKDLIDCQVYGALGCSVLTWGWVDSSGLESQIFSNQGGQPIRGNTQAWFDSKQATTEWRALMPVLLTPVEDSPLLGLGTVVSAASSSVSASVACSVNLASIYANSAVWPDAPAWFVTHTDPATGDQYIFANNLCAASAPFSETFTLAHAPAGATEVEVLNEGRTLPIVSGQFTDTWQDNDVHIYVIRTPRGAYIH